MLSNENVLKGLSFLCEGSNYQQTRTRTHNKHFIGVRNNFQHNFPTLVSLRLFKSRFGRLSKVQGLRVFRQIQKDITGKQKFLSN